MNDTAILNLLTVGLILVAFMWGQRIWGFISPNMKWFLASVFLIVAPGGYVFVRYVLPFMWELSQ